jgi:hypothetical protein
MKKQVKLMKTRGASSLNFEAENKIKGVQTRNFYLEET